MTESFRPEDPESAQIWDELELPPPSPVPLGFAGKVVAHCRRQAEPSLSAWGRLAAATALLLGIGLGIGIDRRDVELRPAADPSSIAPSPPEAPWASDPPWSRRVPSLAEQYWQSEAPPEFSNEAQP